MENFILNPDIEKRLREGNKLDKAINSNNSVLKYWAGLIIANKNKLHFEFMT
jgi:hypothetical protein